MRTTQTPPPYSKIGDLRALFNADAFARVADRHGRTYMRISRHVVMVMLLVFLAADALAIYYGGQMALVQYAGTDVSARFVSVERTYRQKGARQIADTRATIEFAIRQSSKPAVARAQVAQNGRLGESWKVGDEIIVRHLAAAPEIVFVKAALAPALVTLAIALSGTLVMVIVFTLWLRRYNAWIVFGQDRPCPAAE